MLLSTMILSGWQPTVIHKSSDFTKNLNEITITFSDPKFHVSCLEHVLVHANIDEFVLQPFEFSALCL